MPGGLVVQMTVTPKPLQVRRHETERPLFLLNAAMVFGPRLKILDDFASDHQGSRVRVVMRPIGRAAVEAGMGAVKMGFISIYSGQRLGLSAIYDTNC